jgi:cystathionine beta-lyase/cystathionine gamma-synthase
LSHEHKLDTQVIHAGTPTNRLAGAVVTPIVQSATFDFTGDQADESLRYIRYSNTPNHEVLHRRLAALEAGEAALVTASGMAAITAGLLGVLSAGDHVIFQDSLYGGTTALIAEELERLGITVDRFDGRKVDQLEALVRPETRVIYTEALTNPLVQIADHEGVVAFARQRDLVTMIDATFATPVNFRPLALGYDLALHSATKYLNGHSDIVAGVVVGRADLVALAGQRMKHFGGALDPHACFLLERGLKTLVLRMERHNATTLTVARFLDDHPAVLTVHYPGLEDHPDHARGKALFRGFGGVLAFDLDSGEAAATMIGQLKLATAAPSLGGVETLVSRPMLTSHAALSPAERARVGISDGLVRLAVGIEAAEDLIADLDQALAVVVDSVVDSAAATRTRAIG